MNIAVLLERAGSAKPEPDQKASKRWVNLLPVFETLLSRGFNGRAAVKWLIEQGEVTTQEEDKAFFALHQARNRRKKLHCL